MPKQPSKSAAKKFSTSRMAADQVRRGVPLPFGALLRRTGINFSVFSKYATACTLVLFNSRISTSLLPSSRSILRPIAPARFGTPSLKAWMPVRNTAIASTCSPIPILKCIATIPRTCCSILTRMRFPTARLGGPTPETRPPRYSVVAENHFDWQHDEPLNIPLVDTVIYETHVRSFTRHSSSGVAHPGTFAGLIERIPYLKQLGVTAVGCFR